jgi:hypothetical protein
MQIPIAKPSSKQIAQWMTWMSTSKCSIEEFANIKYSITNLPVAIAQVE